MNAERDQDAEEAGNIRLALAAVAMHAILPMHGGSSGNTIAQEAVNYADELLAALAAPR